MRYREGQNAASHDETRSFHLSSFTSFTSFTRCTSFTSTTVQLLTRNAASHEMRLEALPNEGDVDGLLRLVSRSGEANAEKLRQYLRAKMAECLVKDVVQANAKMFTFAGGFQGYAWAAVLTTLALLRALLLALLLALLSTVGFRYAWAAVLTTLAHMSAEGLDQLICVVDLAKWYMEHVAAGAEPEHRIVTSQQAESKGVVHLFASLLQVA